MVYILPIWKHIHNAYIFPLAELPETPLSWQFSHLLTFFLIFRLSKKLKGGCHKEVGAPKNGIVWGSWPLSWRPSVFQPLPWYLDRCSSTPENTL